MTEERLAYRFGPLERRGLLGGLNLRQALAGGAGTLGGILLLDASPTPAGLIGALVVVLAALAIARTTYGDRPLVDWLLIGATFASRRRARKGGPPTRSLRPRSPVPRGTGLEAPRVLRGLRLAGIEHGGTSIGVLVDGGARRMTAVLACRSRGFALLDPEVQERRLQAWGTLLASLPGTPVRRLQWLERTAPAQGDELVKWFHDERDPRLPPRGTPIVDSYLELISASAGVSQEHEVLLAVQVEARRGPEPPGEVIAEQVRRLAAGLGAAEVEVLGALSHGQLARTLRLAFDPYARPELTALDLAAPERRGMSSVAWPAACREQWDHVRIDGSLHATFWISAWPQRHVTPMFLDPLLGTSTSVRAIAVCLEPVAPARSAREIEAAVTRDRADRTVRARFGQLETARARAAQESAMRREQELAVGHGDVCFSAFLTVSGRDEDELRGRCAEVSEQAARARLELRRMYGQQLEAFTFTLPLCRGLR